MNEGMGEGVSYRARVLVAMKTELLDPGDTGPAMVDTETTAPVSEVTHNQYLYLNFGQYKYDVVITLYFFSFFFWLCSYT